MLPAAMIPVTIPSSAATSLSKPDGEKVPQDANNKLDFQKLQESLILALLAQAGLVCIGNPILQSNPAGRDTNQEHASSDGTPTTLANVNHAPQVDSQESIAAATQSSNQVNPKESIAGTVSQDGSALEFTPVSQNTSIPEFAPTVTSPGANAGESVIQEPGITNPPNPQVITGPLGNDTPAIVDAASFLSGNPLTVLQTGINSLLANVANRAAMESGALDPSQFKHTAKDSGTDSPGTLPMSQGTPDLGRAAPPQNAGTVDQVAMEIINHLQGLGQQGKTDFHFHLDPPDLGPVRIHLTASDGVISVRLVVREDSARQILEGQMNTLVQRLTDAGISLGRFDVSREGAGFQESRQNSNSQPMPAKATPLVDSSNAVDSVPESAGMIDLVA